jgi:putative ABC transport system permease protein
METLVTELRFAVRSLRRHKGLAAVAVLCMGLGIGLCVTLFSSINPWLFRPLPYSEPDRLVGLRETMPQRGEERGGWDELSGPDFLDWRAASRSFEEMAAFERIGYNLSTKDEPERVTAARVTATLFPLLGKAPILGRGFRPEEDGPGGPRVALLGHELWRRHFDGDPAVLGRTLKLDGVPHTVVGVMPAGFAFPEYAEVWTPLGLEPGGAGRGDHRLDVVARLAPGATVEQAQAELDTIAATLARQYPDTNRERGAAVRPLIEWLAPPGVVAALRLMLAAGLFVQLIACANVANLLLAKASGQGQEIALRLALGAGRGRLLRQSLVEAALLAGAGAGLGLLLVSWGMTGLFGGTPVRPPFWVVTDVDGAVVAFVAGVTASSAVLVSLAPVLQFRKEQLLDALKEGARSVAGGRRGRLGRALVVSELGLSLVLLIGAALMFQSFVRRYQADPGFDVRGALSARLSLSGELYADPARRAVFLEELARRLEARPDVTSAGVANGLLLPDPLAPTWWGRSFEVEGQPTEPEHAPSAGYYTATSGYLRATGLPLVAGRLFNGEEEAEGRAVVVVSDGLARRLWGDAGAIGRRLRIEGGPWLRVVGLVGETRESSDITWSFTRPPGQIYVPYRRDAWDTVYLVVRTRSDPAALAGFLRDAVRTLDPALPLHSVYTLDEVHARALWVSALWGRMLGVMAAFALFLAALGVYGVVSYAVAQRTHEIGVRMAVGAAEGHVLRLVLGQGLRLALQAATLGLLGAVALARVLAGLLYGVDPLDPATLIGAAALLGLIALAASYFPARRATRVDPLAALRSE